MPSRGYAQNAAAPYSPATMKGSWTATTGFVDRQLSTSKSGAAATVVTTKSVATNPSNLLAMRLVSPALLENKSITGTLQWILGVLESANTVNAFFRVFAYVTQGDSDTSRGTLLTANVGATEYSTAGTGRGEGAKTLSTVNALAGDRIVIEVGHQMQTANTAVTATLHYGNTGATDLTQGSTSVTTQPGWFEFSMNDLFGIAPKGECLSLAGD